jgi:hypothetical protein
MATNFVLSPIQSVKIGAYGAAEGSCVDIGSVRSVAWAPTYDTNYATSSLAGGAKVAASTSNHNCTVKVVGEEVTLANLALAFAASSDGSTYLKTNGAGGAATERTLFADGFTASGANQKLWLPKCVISDPGEIAPSLTEQGLFEMTLNALYDATQTDGERMWKLAPNVADTTPPTITTVSPADGATAVAKAATTVVEWTFSEAIRSEDVNDEKFFVATAAGVVKAGTLALYDTAGTIVRFTPGAAWAATTTYAANALHGIRDLAGNKLAATSSTTFITGA